MFIVAAGGSARLAAHCDGGETIRFAIMDNGSHGQVLGWGQTLVPADDCTGKSLCDWKLDEAQSQLNRGCWAFPCKYQR